MFEILVSWLLDDRVTQTISCQSCTHLLLQVRSRIRLTYASKYLYIHVVCVPSTYVYSMHSTWVSKITLILVAGFLVWPHTACVKIGISTCILSDCKLWSSHLLYKCIFTFIRFLSIKCNHTSHLYLFEICGFVWTVPVGLINFCSYLKICLLNQNIFLFC